MAKVVEQPSSEQSSDNEEINRLFPKCRPRYTQLTGSDVNQNKVFSDTLLSFTDRTNSNVTEDTFFSNCEGNANNQKAMSEGKKHKSQYSETNHDSSILSGYDHSGDSNKDSSGEGCRNDKSHRLIYNPDLDVGYHINSRTAACLRESRIEIAGGREIFSKSKSKPSKKRHSDEVIYHPPPPPHLACDTPTEEVKRFSGEVLYDDNFVQYICSLQGSANKTENSKNNSEQWSHPRKSQTNGKMYGSTSSQSVATFEEPRELPSGQLVYETTVRNAEVVYDDIGELMTDKRNDTASTVNDRNSSNSDENISVPFVGLQETHLIHGVAENNSCNSLRPTTPQPIPQQQQHTQTFSGTDLSAFLQKSKPLAQHLTETGNGTDSQSQSPTVGGKIARVIGNLPIAEYDGSPRRYGPRPGYPHRVLKETAIGKNPMRVDEGQGMNKNEESDHPSSPSDSCQSQQMENFATVPILNAYYLNSFGMGDNEACYLPNEDANSSLDCDHDEDGRLKENSKLSLQGTFHEPPEFDDLDYRLYRVNAGNSYIGKRLAQSSETAYQDSPKSTYCRYNNNTTGSNGTLEDDELCPSIVVKNEQTNTTEEEENPSLVYLPNERGLMLLHERVHQHTLGVDLACGGNTEQDRESLSTFPGTEDLGETEVGEQVDNTRNFTLSPETTDCDSNDVESEVSFEGSLNSSGRLLSSMPILEDGLSSGHSSDGEEAQGRLGREDGLDEEEDENCSTRGLRDGVNWCPNKGSRNLVKNNGHLTNSNPALAMMKQQIDEIEEEISKRSTHKSESAHNKFKVEEYLRKHMANASQQFHHQLPESDLGYFEDRSGMLGMDNNIMEDESSVGSSPEKRRHSASAPPPRETVNDVIREIKHAIQMSKSVHLMNPSVEAPPEEPAQPVWIPRLSQPAKGEERADGLPEHPPEDDECDTDQETDRLLGAQRAEEKSFNDEKNQGNGNSSKKKGASKEVLVHEPAVLIEGVLFRARYLGSTQLVCEGQPTKATRMMQAEEAVSRIKAPEGEAQPSTEVDLFISTEKIMVLNTDLKEIMMDHSLRTISYIADIGDLVVLMARRRILSSSEDVSDAKAKRTPKMICHVFESEEAQFIAQSIGQAFQVAYMEFLKANGIEDSSFVKEMDYQEVLNSQEIFGNELEMFAKKEKQKEVVVPKQKGEILGMVIVESGWGSMLPTVVIANMAQTGPAARCGQLNIGDQIIAINGVSLVGLPLSTCQNYIKNTKNQTVVKLTVVPCAPVVEVKIKRPDTKYQLGFSVQNGVICSLLRGGIAERGGVRVGHRIIEINGQSVVAVPHEKIVNLLATSVGEILMKTMPTSMFRLLTGQESPLFI